jgi:hypothetical protein
VCMHGVGCEGSLGGGRALWTGRAGGLACSSRVRAASPPGRVVKQAARPTHLPLIWQAAEAGTT